MIPSIHDMFDSPLLGCADEPEPIPVDLGKSQVTPSSDRQPVTVNIIRAVLFSSLYFCMHINFIFMVQVASTGKSQVQCLLIPNQCSYCKLNFDISLSVRVFSCKSRVFPSYFCQRHGQNNGLYFLGSASAAQCKPQADTDFQIRSRLAAHVCQFGRQFSANLGGPAQQKQGVYWRCTEWRHNLVAKSSSNATMHLKGMIRVSCDQSHSGAAFLLTGSPTCNFLRNYIRQAKPVSAQKYVS